MAGIKIYDNDNTPVILSEGVGGNIIYDISDIIDLKASSGSSWCDS